MKKLIIILLSFGFGCTVKSNLYTVTEIKETSNGCIYTATGSTMSMFIWNEPQICIFEDDCGLYDINATINCQTLNDYNLDACRN